MLSNEYLKNEARRLRNTQPPGSLLAGVNARRRARNEAELGTSGAFGVSEPETGASANEKTSGTSGSTLAASLSETTPSNSTFGTNAFGSGRDQRNAGGGTKGRSGAATPQSGRPAGSLRLSGIQNKKQGLAKGHGQNQSQNQSQGHNRRAQQPASQPSPERVQLAQVTPEQVGRAVKALVADPRYWKPGQRDERFQNGVTQIFKEVYPGEYEEGSFSRDSTPQITAEDAVLRTEDILGTEDAIRLYDTFVPLTANSGARRQAVESTSEEPQPIWNKPNPPIRIINLSHQLKTHMKMGKLKATQQDK